MIREVTATGRDVNSAIEQGCAQLAIDRDDAQFEIISLPKKGFLGLKTYPAKVRVYQELPDPKPAPKPAPVPARAPTHPAPQRPNSGATPPAPARAPVHHAPQRPNSGVTPPAPARAPVHHAPQRPNSGVTPPPHEFKPQVEVTPTDIVRGKVEKAAVYLAEIMRAMGFEGVEVTPRYYEENVCLQLSGAQMGVVIGRRGETLDALQYLTSLVANRGEGEYIRINIDSGNYREKREKTLTALARKLALQAVRSGKSTTLEPMNPYERRVIHGAVSQIRGATSTSVGADPNRRVVIACADPSKVRPAPIGDRTGPRPPFAGPRPAPTGPRPPFAGPRPAPTTPRPEATEPRPAPVAPRPEATEPRPAPVAPRPEPTEFRPAPVAPRPEATEPRPAPTTPRPEATEPRPAPVAPRPEATEFRPAPVAPRPEATEFRPAPTTPRPERSGDRFAGRGGDRGGRGGDRGGRGGRDRSDRPAPYVPDPNAERPKLSDAELFAGIPTGMPVVSGEPRAPRPAKKPFEKPAPRKLDDVGTPGTYGKIE